MYQTYYKIRLKSKPDMYVKGTPVYHSFDKKGRVFHTLGNLRTFITGIMNSSYTTADISDWEVIEMVMTVKDIRPVHEMIKPERLIQLLKKQGD